MCLRKADVHRSEEGLARSCLDLGGWRDGLHGSGTWDHSQRRSWASRSLEPFRPAPGALRPGSWEGKRVLQRHSEQGGGQLCGSRGTSKATVWTVQVAGLTFTLGVPSQLPQGSRRWVGGLP